MIEQGHVLRRFVLIATVLAGARVLAQAPAPAKASVDADLADRQQVTLLPQTAINLHAGELVAHLGSASDYATVHASTTIGEAKAEQFGQTKDGFFNAVNATGTGPNTFAAHVFTGQITLKE